MFNVPVTGEFIAFFLLSIVMICGAVFMVSLTKVVHMVIALAAVFLGVAGMFVLLSAEFLAFVQVLIYAGAVSILMIFGIMMTKHRDEAAEVTRPAKQWLGGMGALVLFGILFYAIRSTEFPQQEPFTGGDNNVMEIGKALFTSYVIPFELVSVLLTVAFIGAIAVAKKEEE